MRDATQMVSSWEKKLFIIGHLAVAFVPDRSHTSGSRTSRSPRQVPSRRELFPRTAIIADIALRILQHAVGHFRKPLNCIQKLSSKYGRFQQAPLLCFWT